MREYIGADPKKIEEALARIERVKEYERLMDERGQIEYLLGQVQNNLSRVLSICYQVNW